MTTHPCEIDRIVPIYEPVDYQPQVKKVYTLEDGDLMIEFPIGDDDPKKHSQVAPYPANICVKID